MIYKIINLKEEYKQLKHNVLLHIYCPDNYEEIDLNRLRPGLLVLPGGGYYNTSKREGEIVALRFLGYDISSFLLEYSTSEKLEHPNIMLEGYAAINYIRKHADELHVDKNNLNVLGFSAGAHFACALAVHRNTGFVSKYFDSNIDVNINKLILGYPVIVINEEGKKLGTWKNLVSKDPNNLIDFYSIDKNINKDFPKTLVFASKNDPWVSIENTYALIEQLKRNNIGYKSLLFNINVHGSSLGDSTVYEDNFDISRVSETKDWYKDAINFINEV